MALSIARRSLAQLEAKLSESRAQADVLIARYRRARLAQSAATASSDGNDSSAARMNSKVLDEEAKAFGSRAMLEMDDSLKLEQMERADRVDHLLASLRGRIEK